MEMATKTDNRAHRRRRIMSREMDRMAFITGVRNLPPSPPPSPTAPSPFLHQRGHSHTGISPSFFAKELPRNHDSIPLANIQAIPEHKDDKPISLLKRLSISEIQEVNNTAIENQINHKKLDPIREASTEIVSSPSFSTVNQNASFDNQPLPETHSTKPRLFTSKRLNACILASQTTRAFCSLIIASLAILSHIDHPLFMLKNIARSESVVASNPLYILLLTDATIVVARMLTEREKDSGEAEGECEKVKEDGQNWDSAVKVLERGLVFYQAFRAIFIDFSVYAVAVICGFSLVCLV